MCTIIVPPVRRCISKNINVVKCTKLMMLSIPGILKWQTLLCDWVLIRGVASNLFLGYKFLLHNTTVLYTSSLLQLVHKIIFRDWFYTNIPRVATPLVLISLNFDIMNMSFAYILRILYLDSIDSRAHKPVTSARTFGYLWNRVPVRFQTRVPGPPYCFRFQYAHCQHHP